MDSLHDSYCQSPFGFRKVSPKKKPRFSGDSGTRFDSFPHLKVRWFVPPVVEQRRFGFWLAPSVLRFAPLFFSSALSRPQGSTCSLCWMIDPCTPRIATLRSGIKAGAGVLGRALPSDSTSPPARGKEREAVPDFCRSTSRSGVNNPRPGIAGFSLTRTDEHRHWNRHRLRRSNLRNYRSVWLSHIWFSRTFCIYVNRLSH